MQLLLAKQLAVAMPRSLFKRGEEGRGGEDIAGGVANQWQ